MTQRTGITRILLATVLLVSVTLANAQTVIEQAAEHRYQIDFRVNDAALAKMLPTGWETVIQTQGPAKDCNLRMIFIDRMAIMAEGGKTAAPHATRMVYLAIPVRQTGTKNEGQIIIHGLTDNAADATVMLQVMLTKGETVKGNAKQGMTANYFERTLRLKVVD